MSKLLDRDFRILIEYYVSEWIKKTIDRDVYLLCIGEIATFDQCDKDTQDQILEALKRILEETNAK